MRGHIDPKNSTPHPVNSARRVGIAVDSCALLTPEFIENNRVAVAPMRINIGRDSFPDNPRLDYNAFYGLLANEPNLRAWTAAPKPDVWLDAINQAARGVDAVVCITVAAGLSASYDSARVAAKTATESNPKLDIRVIDSGTISGALKLMAMDVTRAVDLGMDSRCDRGCHPREKTRSANRRLRQFPRPIAPHRTNPSHRHRRGKTNQHQTRCLVHAQRIQTHRYTFLLQRRSTKDVPHHQR